MFQLPSVDEVPKRVVVRRAHQGVGGVVEQLDANPVERSRDLSPRRPRICASHVGIWVSASVRCGARSLRPPGGRGPRSGSSPAADDVEVLRDAIPIDWHAAHIHSRRRRRAGRSRRFKAGEGELTRETLDRHDSVPRRVDDEHVVAGVARDLDGLHASRVCVELVELRQAVKGIVYRDLIAVCSTTRTNQA